MPPLPPDVIVALVLQFPLVAVVAWAFVTGKVHSPAEMARVVKDLMAQIGDWRALYQQERSDRIEADRRLTAATSELKEVTTRVEELTKEVIRGSRG